jgi:thiol-disulfide isomerase/thioredoxin
MYIKPVVSILAALLLSKCILSQGRSDKKNKIIINVTADPPPPYQTGDVNLIVRPAQGNQFQYPVLPILELNQPLKNGFTRFELPTNESKYINCSIFPYSQYYLIEPGDSINIVCNGSEISFTGKGSNKIRFLNKITELERALMTTDLYKSLSEAKRAPVSSLNDYLAWNSFLNEKTRLIEKKLDSIKPELSSFAYTRLRGNILQQIEKTRMHKYHSLRRSTIVGPLNQFGLSNEDLCKIFDTTMNNASSKWLRFERDYLYDPDYSWGMLHDEDYRRRGKFFKTNKSDTSILGQDPADTYVYIYNRINELYKGAVRENHLAYTFYDYGGILHELGFTPKTEALLADYYDQVGYPEAKKMVRDYEMEQRLKWNRVSPPSFNLTNIKGETFNSQQLKGKIAIFDFWFTGCVGCVQMAPALRKVEEEFRNDTNIVFLSVSVDKKQDQWSNSVSRKKYTTGSGLQFYTGGLGKDHDIIKRFFVESYPTIEVLNQDGLFLKYNKKNMDPRLDGGKNLAIFLKKQVALLKDGPYVFYSGDSVEAISVNNAYLSKEQLSQNSLKQVTAYSDQNIPFVVNLRQQYQPEPATFKRPDKLLALSDIEGNFDAFRKLLQKNKIIDQNLNWIFGDGHLVFGGDMFDRGNQVTECLWLIYSLEDQAKKAGGYVHFILGNHEVMNLQGDHRYVETKYKENAALMGKTLSQLYSESSELGRWLRTKNIVEKIGDMLFLHGGISRKINQLSLSVEEINQLARPNYALKKDNYGDNRTNSIMNTATSPFWYRTYYDGKKEMPQIIDSTLQHFGVNHIVTGHTIVADTISLHYDNKIINTDTHHADGKSEALLIEGNNFYRVGINEEKFFLFSKRRRYILLETTE